MTDLHEAARRALDSLDDLIANTTDPGVEALGARHELATALIGTPAAVPSAPADRAAIERARAEGAIEALRSAAEHARLGAAVGPIPLEVRPAVAAWLCRLAEQRRDRALREAAELRRMAVEAQQPASTAPLAANLPLVKGRCPACNGASLFLGDGGYVTCSRIDCPEPDAASTALEQPAVEAQQPETQADAHPPTVTWEIESPRRGTWASWGTNYDEHDWARQRFEDAIGHVPARRFRLVRATTTYTVEAEHLPAAVSQPVEARQADTAGEQQ